MAKTKQFIDMSKRSDIIIVPSTAKSQKKARLLVREEFSPHVSIEANPESYLISLKKGPSAKSDEKGTVLKLMIRSLSDSIIVKQRGR